MHVYSKKKYIIIYTVNTKQSHDLRSAHIKLNDDIIIIRNTEESVNSGHLYSVCTPRSWNSNHAKQATSHKTMRSSILHANKKTDQVCTLYIQSLIISARTFYLHTRHNLHSFVSV